jgi:hypothetical protein
MRYTIDIDKAELAGQIGLDVEEALFSGKEPHDHYIVDSQGELTWVKAPLLPGEIDWSDFPPAKLYEYALLSDILYPEILEKVKQRVKESSEALVTFIKGCLPDRVVVEQEGRKQARVVERIGGVKPLESFIDWGRQPKPVHYKKPRKNNSKWRIPGTR